MEHLVYCEKEADVLSKLLDGSKTMIVRGAAGRKLPYGRVFEGETLYFIVNDGSGLVKAKGRVFAVHNSESLSKEEAEAALIERKVALNLSDKQFKRWNGKKRYCFVEVVDVTALDEPFEYDRQKNMDDWITVESIDDLKVGSDHVYESVRIQD